MPRDALQALLFALVLASASHAQTVEFLDMCDGSAGTALDAEHFVSCDDETNRLSVYSRSRPGPPVVSWVASDFLNVRAKHKECDIEGAATLGGRVFWIASHCTNKSGDPRPNRRRLFATAIGRDGEGRWTIEPDGRPYARLLEDMCADPRLARYNLEKASRIPPKEEGGLSIEGLAATSSGQLLIGFRNPMAGEKALLVPLANPGEVVDSGSRAVFGEPIELDLGGLAIRSIEYSRSRGRYLIVAGPYHQDKTFELYEWSGRPADGPEKLEQAPGGISPEGAVLFEGDSAGLLLLLSDDGLVPRGGVECKELPRDAQRGFRGVFVRLPPR